MTKRRKNMKVRIINAQKNTYWYANKIGEEFLVEEKDKTHYKVFSTSPLLIMKIDCEIIEDEVKQEQPTQRYIRLFPSGAIRSDNRGRERYDWISPLALKELAQYLATTENSFAQINYFKGIKEEACVESLLRHLNEYQITGNKKDAVGALFNCVALIHTIALKERGEYVEHRSETVYMPESEYKEKLKKGEL